MKTRSLILILLLSFSLAIKAANKIALLDFELHDLTALPHTQEEIAHTATITPLLKQALTQTGNYEIEIINAEQIKSINPGIGYLFDKPDLAVELGRQLGANWLIIGQHAKPSFLFSYLRAQLVEIKTGKLKARFEIEMKGNHVSVTEHSVKSLAREIEKVLGNHLINVEKKEPLMHVNTVIAKQSGK